MLEGTCIKCGTHYYGWSLKLIANRICEKCGQSLEITDEVNNALTGYSPVKDRIIGVPRYIPSHEGFKKKKFYAS